MSGTRHQTFVMALCLCGLAPLASAARVASVPDSRSKSKQSQVFSSSVKKTSATRVERPPRLDGTLDDDLWKLAQPINDFLEREPSEGQPPTEKTEVRILYTRTAVYFGIAAYDSCPSQIVATELRRDVSQDLDDHFEIMIDPNHDRRNAYVFQINPLGTQRDGVITEENGSQDGGDFDTGWDGVWASNARVTATGWSATVEIPFTTLNFTQSNDVVWGLNLKRFIRSKNEEDLWTSYSRIWGIDKVSEAGELTGITEIGSGRLFIVKPYGVLGAESLTGTGIKGLHTGGVDVKYGIRSSLVANLTVNTDFADSDVDTEQFNLTPFRLFFPEKRQFFLENSGIFDFFTSNGDRLFFSRQIGIDPNSGDVVPIDVGGKVTGSLGKYQVGLLDVRTGATGRDPYSNFGVVRVKRSLFGDSYIGAIAIDKRSGDPNDSYNQAVGVDTRLVFFKNLNFVMSASRTRSPSSVGGSDSNYGGFAFYDTSTLHFATGGNYTGANYNPEAGFLQRSDLNSRFGFFGYTPRPKIPHVREVDFQVFLFHALDTHNVLQTQEWSPSINVKFNNASEIDTDPADVTIQRITSPFNIYKNVFIPNGVYAFSRHHIAYTSAQDRRVTFNVSERFGPFYSGRLNELSFRVTYRPTARFSASVGDTWNSFRIPVPNGNFAVHLASTQANYSFSRFLSFTALLQMDTANTQAVSANVRLRYNYRPDSDFYIIYNQGTRFASLTATNPAQLRDQRIEAKFTYSFQPHFGRLGHSDCAPGPGAASDSRGSAAADCSAPANADLDPRSSLGLGSSHPLRPGTAFAPPGNSRFSPPEGAEN